MRIELAVDGHNVKFVAVNMQDAEDTQQKLVDKCAFPLFQDVAAVNAWGLHGGAKDDFFVYNKDGTLAAFLPISGEVSVDLSTEEGYNNLKQAILDAIAGNK